MIVCIDNQTSILKPIKFSPIAVVIEMRIYKHTVTCL